jgi:DNA-binding IclR family transcriptional regulator
LAAISLNETAPVGGPIALNRSVERACSLLTAFSLDDPQLSLAELARRVGLPKPTVYRLAASLQAAGFMTQGEDGRYGLGFRLLQLGAVVRENLDIVRTCSAGMESLAAATGETVILGQVDWPAREVTIVHRLDSAHTLSVLSPIGRRSKLPPGCLGKALLMGLSPADRKRVLAGTDLPATTSRSHTNKRALLKELERQSELGYCVEEDEFLNDVSGVAAPVIHDGGWPLAAIGVVGPSTRLKGKLDEIGALVARVADGFRESPAAP